jgi:subtilisin family serine protease
MPTRAFAQEIGSQAAPSSPPVITDVGGEVIPGQYVVVLKKLPSLAAVSTEINTLSADLEKKGVDVVDTFNKVGGFVLKTNETAAPEIVNQLKADPQVAAVEPDKTVVAFANAVPTGINRIDGDLSKTKSGDGSGDVNVDIAIIDTGIQLNHPDLNVFKDVSFVNTANGNDDNGHGTHVAGSAAAKDNDIGVVGVAPGARLWAVKVLDSAGSGTISGVIAGVDYVTQHADEIDVANMSLGCECDSAALETAINNSVAAGITYVVAAANAHKDAGTFSPAKYSSVITVSALADSDGKCGAQGAATQYGADDSFASFSNYGTVVDVMAPGVNIYSTWLNSGYNTISGTSMASPHVAGAAALYKSLNPSATPSAVATYLKTSGSTPNTQCDGNGHGYATNTAQDLDNVREPLLYVKDNSNTSPPSGGNNIIHRILKDDSNGNSKGWNPNGNTRVFVIKDSDFDPQLSVAGIDTKQRNYVVCSVDYWVKGAFEVVCTTAPSNGGTLSYVIVNTQQSSSTSIQSLAADQQSELTARAKTAPK